MATSKRGQAAHGIEEIFKLINIQGTITVTLLQRFEQYLNRHHKLKELDGEQLPKNARLFRIQKKLIDLSPETFDIVYRWIKDFSGKLSISKTDLRAINNTVLEFALTEVFKHQRYPPLCDKNKFDQLLVARFLRIANKKRTGVYASLEVLLEESVEEIKTKCIEYLKTKPKPFPLDERQVKSILRENKTIDSHISYLESSDEGDPFIFYAASIVYQHHIHVLCAAEEGLEECVFYPSELPTERESCDHKFIGHLSENNYFSLVTQMNMNEEKKLKKEFEKKLIEVEAKIKLQEIKSFQEIIQKKHSYDLEGEVEVKPEILENGLGINTGDKLSFKEAVKDDIDKDTIDINEMVLSAKHGKWEEVWKKLKQKPYIVNCIPEDRAWSALHQAIYLGNLEAVKKLVEDFEADPGCYTKPDIANVAEPGTNAVSLAQQLGQNKIYDYLMHHFAISHLAIKSQNINFVEHRNKELYPFQKHSLLKITMASYKFIFSSDKYPCEDQMKHLSKITDGIFKASDAVWKDAAVKIYHTLYGIERGQTETLLNSQSKEEFFRKLVCLYTGESIYHFLTPALSRQPKTPFKPLAKDLSVAPFALTLTAVLMYWEDIEPFGGVTYRGVSSNVVDQYKPGQTLMFISFISSSKKLSVAKGFAKDQGTLFIFRNTADKTWQPRSIEKHSIFSYEEECLYPLGAEFSVDSVDKTKREVTLTLLNSTV